MKILVVSNNRYIAQPIVDIIEQRGDECDLILGKFNWADVPKCDLIISAHSKTIFPKEILESVRCINIHPGLLPHGRGMYPHVWDMALGRPTGATIHEMTEKIDTGKIIVQREVHVSDSDTSLEVYNKILITEKRLFAEHYDLITRNEPLPYYSQKDFDEICQIDMDHEGTLGEHINFLRALSHDEYKNAYFVSNGKKIYVSIKFTI
jgi:methionyl-tRNA formyltransferase